MEDVVQHDPITAYAAVLGRRETLTTNVRSWCAFRRRRVLPDRGVLGCFADAVVLRVAATCFADAVTQVHDACTAPHPGLHRALARVGAVSLELLDEPGGPRSARSPSSPRNATWRGLSTAPYEDGLRPRIEPGALRSMLSLNEGEQGLMEGEWLWSDDGRRRNGAVDVARRPDCVAQQVLATDGTVPSRGRCGAEACTGCPFLDQRQGIARDARDFETLRMVRRRPRDAQ